MKITRREALNRGGKAAVAAAALPIIAAAAAEPSVHTTEEATVQFFEAGLAVRSRLSQQGAWTEKAEKWFRFMCVCADAGSDEPRYYDHWSEAAKKVEPRFSSTVAALDREIESGRAS